MEKPQKSAEAKGMRPETKKGVWCGQQLFALILGRKTRASYIGIP